MRKRPLAAIGQTLLINVAVNRFDAWALGEPWAAEVGPKSWWRNLNLGWEWDENQFNTNMFSHPYHGSLYFNAGRANGLEYWEAAPLAFLGSWTWEYLGETYRPSLNDFVMTSFGGIALGEMFHRIGSSIRDERRTGSSRVVRELLAMPFDPVGGLNRLLRGRWGGPAATNPTEHDPGSYVLRIQGGMRSISLAEDSVKGAATALIDLQYGDPFFKPYKAPYDVFNIRAQISSAGSGLHLVRGTGRLYGKTLRGSNAGHHHIFSINQRFDFVSNPSQEFGAQSVEAGIHSRWRLSSKLGLRTQVFGDVVVLGAIDAPDAGFGERTYDFGPGAGFRLEAGLETRGITFLTFFLRTEFLHSVSGAAADHLANFGGIEATIPIKSRFGIGIHSGWYDRTSDYTDKRRQKRHYPEARLVGTWTFGGLPRTTR